ncbi:leucine-rich repeat domain-containing protein [Ructibacterium gallinarum]|uniref:Leucine-rich repeat protein n=1 Tax=Ructibacterium gallinarum TaxID=2779355 RepID=A0A9D5LZ68_9FIRM|nr:leucine-rich repeat domain-containing protein [Ructibacterium gallinarum]MBE5040743.1 leucine-rich repeat protein [Ructibacterium gallinarum]
MMRQRNKQVRLIVSSLLIIVMMIVSVSSAFVVIAMEQDDYVSIPNTTTNELSEKNDGLILSGGSPDDVIEKFMEPLEMEQENTEIFVSDGIMPKLSEDDDVTLFAASEIIASGECGDNLTWKVDSSGTLTISGNGELFKYYSNSEVPWSSYAADIRYVNLDIYDSTLCANGNCYAFNMLDNVEEIAIPEGITAIRESVYMFPRKLSKLILPSTYTGGLSNNNLIRHMCHLDIEVAEDNPVYCSVDGTLFSKDRTKIVQYTKSAIEPNYVIPDSVTDIDSAFYHNLYLETLTISKNVEIVDKDTYNHDFWDWGMGMDACYSQCRAVYVDEENPYFCDVDGVLYNKDMTILIWCPPHKSGDSYIIPDSVKVIAPGAFEYSRFSCIPIPDGVEILGRDAFSDSAVKNVTLSGNLKAIYGACFWCCYNLEKVIIENDEIAYSYSCFANCYNLKTAGPIGSGCDIEFCWTAEIPDYVFSSCNALTEIMIPDSITALGMYSFSGCTSLDNISLPDGIFSIECGAFEQCEFTSITIPNRVSAIGEYAFFDCANLAEITIPYSVSTIGNYAFENCASLSNIYVDKVEGTTSGAPWNAPNANITYLRKLNIAPITESYTYTGNPITQTVSITEAKADGAEEKILTIGRDYVLYHSRNKNVGTAVITVSYINDYANLKAERLTFAITPKSCNNLLIAPIPNQACTGRALTPNPTIKDTEI